MNIIYFIYKYLSPIYIVDYITIFFDEDMEYLLEKIELDFDKSKFYFRIINNILIIRYKFYDANPDNDCYIEATYEIDFLNRSEIHLRIYKNLNSYKHIPIKSKKLLDKYTEFFYRIILFDYHEKCLTGITNRIKNKFENKMYLMNPQYGGFNNRLY